MKRFRKYLFEPAFLCLQLASFLRLVRKIGDEHYSGIRPADAILSLVVYDIWFWGTVYLLVIVMLLGHFSLTFLGWTLFSFVPVSLGLRLLLDWGVKKQKNRK